MSPQNWIYSGTKGRSPLSHFAKAVRRTCILQQNGTEANVPLSHAVTHIHRISSGSAASNDMASPVMGCVKESLALCSACRCIFS